MKKKILKRLLKILAIITGAVLLCLIGVIVFLSVTEYKPAPRQAAEYIRVDTDASPAPQSLTVYTWNIGYGGLGKESDFFMDGGKMVNPPSQQVIQKNLNGITAFMDNSPADAWLIQEVDLNSARTSHINELDRLSASYQGSHAFAYNYKCPFVPIPLPPMGKMESGIATLTRYTMEQSAERVSLPCPFSWPVRTANIKRCLLVTRIPVAGSDRELVLVNLHLEAYDDGEGKIAQTKLLLEVLQAEYEKGNYVIAGGDFNQTFPGALEKFPIADPDKWTPGMLDSQMLPEGWQFAYDSGSATCRLLDYPYDGNNQKYVIDGFILSPNVTLNSVSTVDLGFQFSDHNPVKLEVTLAEE